MVVCDLRCVFTVQVFGDVFTKHNGSERVSSSGAAGEAGRSGLAAVHPQMAGAGVRWPPCSIGGRRKRGDDLFAVRIMAVPLLVADRRVNGGSKGRIRRLSKNRLSGSRGLCHTKDCGRAEGTVSWYNVISVLLVFRS